jgi:hypothetical protein
MTRDGEPVAPPRLGDGRSRRRRRPEDFQTTITNPRAHRSDLGVGQLEARLTDEAFV